MLGISIFFHVLFAWHQPFTNDEGAYLYDARTIREGAIPAGDVLTKAPVPIIVFAAGAFVTGNSLFAARIVNSIASIVTVVPLFFLLRVVGGKKSAYIGAAFWLLGSGTIVFHTIGHTQAIASLFAVSSLCFFVLGIRQRGSHILDWDDMRVIFLAGFCFALAYASRKSAIALLAPLVLSWIIFRDSFRGWWRVVGIFGIGVLTIIIPWMGGIYALYGLAGIWHMLGGAYGDMLVHSSLITPWASGSDRMFREAARIGILYGIVLVTICAFAMRNRVLVGASWIAALAVLYSLWPTHLVEYLADFIPSLVLAGAVTLSLWRLAIWQWCVVALLCIAASATSLHSVYKQPWTGMFHRDAVSTSAKLLTEYVPAEEEIFTAAVIVPYVSGHHVPFHLSHPQWYRYAFISDKNRDVFLPAYEGLQQEIKTHTTWALREQLTDYVYPGILGDTFREVFVTPNNTLYRQNPLRIYTANDK